jgi:hypothetical protein
MQGSDWYFALLPPKFKCNKWWWLCPKQKSFLVVGRMQNAKDDGRKGIGYKLL